MGEFAAKVEEANKHGEAIKEASAKIIDTDEYRKPINGWFTTKYGPVIDQNIVKDSVKNVTQLNTRSQEISKLVVVIKDIAINQFIIQMQRLRQREQGNTEKDFRSLQRKYENSLNKPLRP